MSIIKIPNRKIYHKPFELQNFLKIHVNPCNCKNPPLKIHYSKGCYKLTCLRCKKRVGTMEIHGKIVVSVKDIYRFIQIVIEKYQSTPEMKQWKLSQN